MYIGRLSFALICMCHTLSATIVEVYTLQAVEQECSTLDKNSLALFDVDYTLIVPDDAILRPLGEELKKKIVSKTLNDPFVVPEGKYPRGYLSSKIMLHAKSSLVDPQSLLLIKNLQDKHVPTIAITAMPAGKFGIIENLADWRIEELKQFGFDFSNAFPKTAYVDLQKEKGKEFKPLFKSGVLFTSKHPKGDILKQFLQMIHFHPNKVILVDDRMEYLESVESVLSEMGIEFFGFYYTAAEKLPCTIDEELAKFQFDYIVKHAKWLSDEKARQQAENLKN